MYAYNTGMIIQKLAMSLEVGNIATWTTNLYPTCILESAYTAHPCTTDTVEAQVELISRVLGMAIRQSFVLCAQIKA